MNIFKGMCILGFATLLMAPVLHAERQFQPFKFGVGFGYMDSEREGTDAGFIVASEPAVYLRDEISLGFRAEAAIIANGDVERNSNGSVSSELDTSVVTSYALTLQYYLSNGSFRPFVGAGVGLYNIGAIKIETNASGNTSRTEAAASSDEFGFFPRVGFDWGHFNVTADYNIIPDTDADAAVVVGTGQPAKFKNSYLGIKAGFFFGGSRI